MPGNVPGERYVERVTRAAHANAVSSDAVAGWLVASLSCVTQKNYKYSNDPTLRELTESSDSHLLTPDRAGEGHLLSEKGVTAILLAPLGTLLSLHLLMAGSLNDGGYLPY